MPIGSSAAVGKMAHQLMLHSPKRVLDLGIGFGMYGAVVRQWLDLGVKPWKTHLTGVEAWASYRNPVWDLYDVIFVETIEHFIDRCADQFDCVIMGDVIEHMEKPLAFGLLSALQNRVAVGGHLFVITPATFVAQEAVHGNDWERHRSAWQPSDFEPLGFQMLLHGQEPQDGFLPTLLASWRRLG